MGADVHAAGLRIQPQIEFSARVQMGDTAWKIKSGLADAGASASSEFESGAERSIRAAGRLEIASSGSSSALNDAGDGTEEPWSWSLSLSAAFEAAEGSEKAAIFGVKYRQLF